ncbi:glycoside hydrolase family 140 protein [Botryobacter ruber]|uniref:glycoside hydrolase family 140 protein n=1 Tax=Botryobacter ruber TaxID=2171629 RepID=UPI000E0B7254|nr:glycoside hydrolase family 140 protein [Botryobacter ruber]
MFKSICSFLLLALLFTACDTQKKTETAENENGGEVGKLKISENGRYFMKADGEPFFWLGDTGWLLFSKLTRQEADTYLENRQQKGFNVVQVMTLHTVGAVNAYGDTALVNKNLGQPKVTEGNNPEDSTQYDFWDHVDYIVDNAAKRGIYMAMVPIWGTDVKGGMVTQEQAEQYATFLANRYKDRENIIWLNGGDIKGSDSLQVWNTIGKTLRQHDSNHLITFHPRGRTSSTDWFHNEEWLDFNMFQSGHRNYAQDTSAGEERHYGEDNWKFINAAYSMKPVKPILDGEPSYEMIPQGLHDPEQPYWNASDVRRYGYWSVFAGGSGYTYGHNTVMQMLKPSDKGSAFGAKGVWNDAIDHPGAAQMVHLKKLMLSRPYFERVPDQSLIAGEQGEKYDRLMATRGKDYAFIYTYTGRDMKINMGKIEGENVKASWYNPRNGTYTEIGTFPNKGVQEFNPPGEKENGNDWVLVLDKT